eukprot:GHVR01112576.1.p1 GENE.GHVR01112576.1~~GHVR01112576.1.p1  ORF type:complete len:275 (+),score=30.96 GHVR01112576.1:78-902(+)
MSEASTMNIGIVNSKPKLSPQWFEVTNTGHGVIAAVHLKSRSGEVTPHVLPERDAAYLVALAAVGVTRMQILDMNAQDERIERSWCVYNVLVEVVDDPVDDSIEWMKFHTRKRSIQIRSGSCHRQDFSGHEGLRQFERGVGCQAPGRRQACASIGADVNDRTTRYNLSAPTYPVNRKNFQVMEIDSEVDESYNVSEQRDDRGESNNSDERREPSNPINTQIIIKEKVVRTKKVLNYTMVKGPKGARALWDADNMVWEIYLPEESIAMLIRIWRR